MDHRPATGARSSSGRRFRTGLGGALVMLMITSAYMQYTLGVLGPVLIERFSLSRTQLGLLTTMLFVVGSTGSPFAGRLIDRSGARRVLPVPFLATIVGFTGLAVAPSYPVALGAVAVAGVGMAFANPLSNKLIALHVARGQQGLLMGIKQSGVQVGAVIAGVVMPAAVLAAGMSGALAGTAALLAIGLVAVLAIVPADPADARGTGTGRSWTPEDGTIVAPPGDHAETTHGRVGTTDDRVAAADDGASAERPADVPVTPAALLRWIGTYALLMGAGTASVYAYLPLFAFDELGLSVSRAGVLASLIGFIGVASRILWGALSERVGHPSLVLTLLAGTAVFAQTMIWGSPLLGSWAVWLAAIVLGASAVAWNVVAMYAVVKVLGGRAAGQNSGFVQLGFFSGFAIGPIGFGLVSDLSGGYTAGWAAVTACFVLACALAARWASVTRRATGRLTG